MMSDDAPTGREGDARHPKPPWEDDTVEKDSQQEQPADLLETILSGSPDDRPDAAPAEATQTPDGLDALFEQRVREAAREIGDADAPVEADAEDDNPLGVYATLEEAQPEVEPSPPESTEPPPEPSRPEPPDEDLPVREAETDIEAPAEPASEAVEDKEPAVEPETRLSGSARDVDLPLAVDHAPPRPEPPSRLAEGDRLSEDDQKRADRLAKELSGDTSLVTVRYGLMRHVAVVQHRLETLPGPGAHVVVRTDRGVELGEVLQPICGDACRRPCVSPMQVAAYATANGPEYPMKRQGKVIRLASPQDLADHRELRRLAHEARRFCQAQADELNLAMRMVTVEPLLGGERMVFYFSAEHRVDFRELVKRMTAKYQTRVEMRQVGSRDEARLVGDFERCGRQCCCQTFLKELKPISMRMAKVQKATLDPTKVSGRCGRLMCCLRYEDDGYRELRATLPKKGIWVRTESVVGKVMATHILTQLVELSLSDHSRAVIGCEEIVERDVAAPPVQARPSAAPPPDRSQRPLLREQAPPEVQPAEPDEQPESGPEDAAGTPPKKRRRRRRKKRSPSSSAEGAPRPQAQAAQTSAEETKKRRRRRRRKPRAPKSGGE